MGRTTARQTFFWVLLVFIAFGLNRWLSTPGQEVALREAQARTEPAEPQTVREIDAQLISDLIPGAERSESSLSQPTATPWPTPEVIRRPMTPDELGVSVDESGLPYEVEIHDYEISTESLGYLHAPGGVVRTMDGIGASMDPTWDADFSPHIDFGEVEDLEISLVWSTFDNGEGAWSDVLGFRLDAPASIVSRWDPYELAYATDGGLGAIVAESVIARFTAEPLGESDLIIDFESTVVGMDNYLLEDFDLIEGVDFILFNNGWGDGSFPLTRGYDADGRLVSMFVLDERRYPWQLLVPDGTPPADVTERRAQLLECLRGERDVMVTAHYWECSGLED